MHDKFLRLQPWACLQPVGVQNTAQRAPAGKGPPACKTPVHCFSPTSEPPRGHQQKKREARQANARALDSSTPQSTPLPTLHRAKATRKRHAQAQDDRPASGWQPPPPPLLLQPHICSLPANPAVPGSQRSPAQALLPHAQAARHHHPLFMLNTGTQKSTTQFSHQNQPTCQRGGTRTPGVAKTPLHSSSTGHEPPCLQPRMQLPALQHVGQQARHTNTHSALDKGLLLEQLAWGKVQRCCCTWLLRQHLPLIVDRVVHALIWRQDRLGHTVASHSSAAVRSSSKRQQCVVVASHDRATALSANSPLLHQISRSSAACTPPV